jgi:hypothetical protein
MANVPKGSTYPKGQTFPFVKFKLWHMPQSRGLVQGFDILFLLNLFKKEKKGSGCAQIMVA